MIANRKCLAILPLGCRPLALPVWTDVGTGPLNVAIGVVIFVLIFVVASR
jgi:hypothetical protein